MLGTGCLLFRRGGGVLKYRALVALQQRLHDINSTYALYPHVAAHPISEERMIKLVRVRPGEEELN